MGPWVRQAIRDEAHAGDGGRHADTGMKSAHLKRRQYKTNGHQEIGEEMIFLDIYYKHTSE